MVTEQNPITSTHDTNTGSKSPRRAHEPITAAALRDQRQRLRGMIQILAYQFPKRDSETDHRPERDPMFMNAEEIAGLAALAWLREFKVSIHKACIYSSMKFATTSLAQGKAEFKFLAPKEVTNQERFFGFLPLLELYSEIVNELKAIWKMKVYPDKSDFRYGVDVSYTRRFGPAQQSGLRKRSAQNKFRAAAVLEVSKKLITEVSRMPVPMPEITESLAQRWLKDLKTPNEVATQILSHYMKRKPRTIKALLNGARKLRKLPLKF